MVDQVFLVGVQIIGRKVVVSQSVGGATRRECNLSAVNWSGVATRRGLATRQEGGNNLVGRGGNNLIRGWQQSRRGLETISSLQS